MNPSLPARFWALFTAYLVSLVGDSAAALSLVLEASSGGSTWRVTEVFLAELVPPLLMAPVLGYVADRMDARRAWIMASVTQTVVFAAATVVTAFQGRVALVSLAGVFGVVGGSASFKLLPHIVGRQRIGQANSRLGVALSSAQLVGPGVGGLAYGTWGLGPVFAGNALSFLAITAVVTAMVPRGLATPAPVAAHPFAGAVAGWQALRHSPVLGPLLLLLAGIMLATSIETTAGVFYLQGVAGSAAVYGLLLTCWSAGSLPGALLGSPRYVGTRLNLMIVGGAALMSVAILASALVPIAMVIGIVFVFGGLGNGLHNVGVRTSIHQTIPEDRHASAWTYYIAMTNISVGIGFILGTPIGLLSARAIVLVSGLLGVAVVVAALVTVRSRLWAASGAYLSTSAHADDGGSRTGGRESG